MQGADDPLRLPSSPTARRTCLIRLVTAVSLTKRPPQTESISSSLGTTRSRCRTRWTRTSKACGSRETAAPSRRTSKSCSSSSMLPSRSRTMALMLARGRPGRERRSLLRIGRRRGSGQAVATSTRHGYAVGEHVEHRGACRACSTSRASCSASAAPLTWKVTRMFSNPLRTSSSMPRIPRRSMSPSTRAVTSPSSMPRAAAMLASPLVRQLPRAWSRCSAGVGRVVLADEHGRVVGVGGVGLAGARARRRRRGSRRRWCGCGCRGRTRSSYGTGSEPARAASRTAPMVANSVSVSTPLSCAGGCGGHDRSFSRVVLLTR